jgi:hypothetical protein
MDDSNFNARADRKCHAREFRFPTDVLTIASIRGRFIRPEWRGRVYWTNVSVNTSVLVGDYAQDAMRYIKWHMFGHDADGI